MCGWRAVRGTVQRARSKEIAMAQMPPNRYPVDSRNDDIYMTLLISAAAVLLIGLIFVAVRSYQLFDSIWPPSAPA
jgi:hypothetical protein